MATDTADVAKYTFTGTLKGKQLNFGNVDKDVTASQTTEFASAKITWDANDLLPSAFTSMTAADFLADTRSVYEVTFSYKVTITGDQAYNANAKASWSTIVYMSGVSTDPTYHQLVQDYYPVGRGTFNNYRYTGNFNNKDLFFDSLITQCTFTPSNSRGIGIVVELVPTIAVQLHCEGSNFEMDVCALFCNQDAESAVACKPLAEAYCFPPGATEAKDMPVGVSVPCQTFLQNYLRNFVGTDAEFDSDLGRYCAHYKTMAELFEDPKVGLEEQNLCACHLDPALYDQYFEQMKQLYPGVENLAVVKPCLLPECSSSPYPSSVTTQYCKGPKCVNFVAFDNQGNIDNTEIKIDQSAEGCQDIVAAQPCSTNGDCPTGQRCSVDHCVPTCALDSDCATGQKCRDGTCGPQCAKTEDCSVGESCVQGKCAKQSDATTCAKDAECAGGLKCQGGHCVEVIGPACAKNADCQADYKCQSGKCVEKTGLPVWAWVLIGLGILAVIVVIIVLLARRKKSAPRLTERGTPSSAGNLPAGHDRPFQRGADGSFAAKAASPVWRVRPEPISEFRRTPSRATARGSKPISSAFSQ